MYLASSNISCMKFNGPIKLVELMFMTSELKIKLNGCMPYGLTPKPLFLKHATLLTTFIIERIIKHHCIIADVNS